MGKDFCAWPGGALAFALCDGPGAHSYFLTACMLSPLCDDCDCRFVWAPWATAIAMGLVQSYFAYVIWSFVQRIKDGTVDKYGRLTIIPLGEFGGFHIREDGQPVQENIPTAPQVLDMSRVPRAIPLINRSMADPSPPPQAYAPGDGNGPAPSAPEFEAGLDYGYQQDLGARTRDYPPVYAWGQGAGVAPVFMSGYAPGHDPSDVAAAQGGMAQLDVDASTTSVASSVGVEVLSAHPPVGGEPRRDGRVELVQARSARPGRRDVRRVGSDSSGVFGGR